MAEEHAVKRHGLAQQVVERIRELVANGTYAVGDRLPAEAQLCEKFGVGRSTLREAMRVLSSRGIVNVRHGEGTFVGKHALQKTFEERLSRAALRDLYEARQVLELPLAELAAARRTAADIAAMRRALKKRERAAANGEVTAYAEADFEFHLAIAKAAKNAALYDVYASFVDVVKGAVTGALDADYLRNEQDTLHEALCNAIAERRVTRLRQLVKSHLRGSRAGIGTLLR